MSEETVMWMEPEAPRSVSDRGAPIIDKIVVGVAFIITLGLFATCAANPRFKCEAMGGDWIPAHQETGSVFGMSPVAHPLEAACEY